MSLEVLLSNEGRLAEAMRELGLPVTVIPEHGVSRLVHARAVLGWLRTRRFDVLHVHRYKEIALGVAAPARARGRLVVTVHGLEPRAQMSWRAALSIWAVLWAARLRGARLVAVSEELRARLARVLGARAVTRIPNPLPPPSRAVAPDVRERFGWPGERPLVAFVGRLEEVKGPDLLLDVAAAGDGSPGFVLIGSGAMEPALRRRVEAEGLGDRVGLLGAVPDAMAYLPQFDALALTSRHEGMPMVLLEAAACAVPVVAFDVGGVAEVLDGGSATRLVPSGDVGAFRSSLDDLLARRDSVSGDLHRWSASVRSRFGVEATGAAYVALYRQVASDDGRRGTGSTRKGSRKPTGSLC